MVCPKPQLSKAIKYSSKPEEYDLIVDMAFQLDEEIRSNRDECSDTSLESFIAEIVFSRYLDSMGIEWKRPQTSDGSLRLANNSDLGDFEIDGKIYDVKSSMKYTNMCINLRSDVKIDYYVGILLIEDRNSRTFTIKINGKIKSTEVKSKSFRRLDFGGYLVSPRNMEKF